VVKDTGKELDYVTEFARICTKLEEVKVKSQVGTSFAIDGRGDSRIARV
jgi:hypothetical protein